MTVPSCSACHLHHPAKRCSSGTVQRFGSRAREPLGQFAGPTSAPLQSCQSTAYNAAASGGGLPDESLAEFGGEAYPPMEFAKKGSGESLFVAAAAHVVKARVEDKNVRGSGLRQVTERFLQSRLDVSVPQRRHPSTAFLEVPVADVHEGHSRKIWAAAQCVPQILGRPVLKTRQSNVLALPADVEAAIEVNHEIQGNFTQCRVSNECDPLSLQAFHGQFSAPECRPVARRASLKRPPVKFL
eukprot:CAMPEP_0196657316 /NCGR_PEP_ID=MMETSP1086-20130531/22572_1 /TAXON_ID=77921 /ORGANISM="Cyanoptyche  gloeocystis , Strain SAG4.97" /LENGTH=241 /DNA_ID=CAMNT_0041990385 /DNA_START=50 /DNA_END=776 /DNA_ORIENTATION=-